jgi:hypothetical protein
MREPVRAATSCLGSNRLPRSGSGITQVANHQDRLIIVRLPPGGDERLDPLPKLVFAADEGFQIVDASGCPRALLSHALTLRLLGGDALASLRPLHSSSEQSCDGASGACGSQRLRRIGHATLHDALDEVSTEMVRTVVGYQSDHEVNCFSFCQSVHPRVDRLS